MATLVLSTVGTALAGPLGGAIGGLIGQSIDQQLFGPGPRRGPRLGDLAVQTSTYGTQVPQVFGTMRVAGSVVWATDLPESSTTTGAKGQPDTITYSYSVSLAVALSSRRAVRIGRIWADGKLLRGAAGDFKVSTGFRFYPGDADQPVDPLIASDKGMALAPAYRGMALAVFEDLELAEFGNRIPFMTFELVADEGAPAIGAIFNAVGDGAIACDVTDSVQGYAAHGGSRRAALEPLSAAYDIRLADAGARLASPAARPPIHLNEDDLGCAVDRDSEPAFERRQVAASLLPNVLTVSHYDAARDYQTGRMRASAGAPGGRAEAIDLPAVTSADAAKALAQDALARRWSARERLTLRLAPRHAALRPGDTVRTGVAPGTWLILSSRIEGFTNVVEASPETARAALIAADGGSHSAPSDLVRSATQFAVVELPEAEGESRSAVIAIAAAVESGDWRALAFEVAGDVHPQVVASARQPTLMGTATSILADGQPELIDCSATVEVELVTGDRPLLNCTDEDLAAGRNLAMLGREMLQFGRAEPLEARRYRLSRLLRGRRGTEWAATNHNVGEPFVLLEPDRVARLPMAMDAVGADVAVRSMHFQDLAQPPITLRVEGEGLQPPSPVRPTIALGADGSVELTWVRRSRLGWTWIDGVDAPLGEATERYRVELASAAGSVVHECTEPRISLSAAMLVPLGAAPWTISIRQIGDHAQSRALTFTYTPA